MFTVFLPIHTSYLESQEKYIILLYLCSRMRKSKVTYRLIFQITTAPTSQNVVSGCPLRMQAGVEKVSFLMICTWKGRARSSDIEITTQNLERSTSRKKTYAIIEAIMHEDAFKKKTTINGSKFAKVTMSQNKRATECDQSGLKKPNFYNKTLQNFCYLWSYLVP